MFRHLDYQDRVLSALDAFIDALKENKARADLIVALAAREQDLALAIPDFAMEAWETLKAEGKLPASRAEIPFSPRQDGCDRPVPNAVLKVPTGGGKTWLAVSGVSRILGRYLDRNTGFVLWIVPNEAIYSQTLRHLKDRQHPYRQGLDRASAGRVRIMQKTDRFDARDVETNLCVMLLMLQSANRETQDSLKMFQDRGDVYGFFPPEGEQQAHKAALERTPNLAAYNDHVRDGEGFPRKCPSGHSPNRDPRRGTPGDYRSSLQNAIRLQPLLRAGTNGDAEGRTATGRPEPAAGPLRKPACGSDGPGAGSRGHDQDAPQPRSPAGNRLAGYASRRSHEAQRPR